MKQTKPYGRAHFTAAERALLAQQNTQPSELPSTQAPDTVISQLDIFSLAGESLSPNTPPPANPVLASLRQGLITLVLVMAGLTVFVLVRDSMILARLLDQLYSRDAVMVCKDGKMYYPDYNPLDRLLGRGYFVCTEWTIQRSLLSIPRPYY